MAGLHVECVAHVCPGFVAVSSAGQTARQHGKGFAPMEKHQFVDGDLARHGLGQHWFFVCAGGAGEQPDGDDLVCRGAGLLCGWQCL